MPTVTDAPEKIWATPDSEDGWRWPVASKFPMQGYSPGAQVSYTRSDMIDAADRIRELEAEVARLTNDRDHWKRWADINSAVAEQMSTRAEAAEAKLAWPNGGYVSAADYVALRRQLDNVMADRQEIIAERDATFALMRARIDEAENNITEA